MRPACAICLSTAPHVVGAEDHKWRQTETSGVHFSFPASIFSYSRQLRMRGAAAARDIVLCPIEFSPGYHQAGRRPRSVARYFKPWKSQAGRRPRSVARYVKPWSIPGRLPKHFGGVIQRPALSWSRSTSTLPPHGVRERSAPYTPSVLLIRPLFLPFQRLHMQPRLRYRLIRILPRRLRPRLGPLLQASGRARP